MNNESKILPGRWFKCLDAQGTGGLSDVTVTSKEGESVPPVDGELELCRNGYHFCRAEDILDWIMDHEGAKVVEVFPDGGLLHGGTKSCARSYTNGKALKWSERERLLFQADCARHVLHIFEKERPKDRRVRDCINAKAAKARGDNVDLAAARYAARAAGDAARAAGAAGDAVGDAAWAAWAARYAARDAAWAARHAAWAAGDAAQAAVDAERAWQTRQLCYRLGLFDEPAEDGYK